jgi:hypothetical protein
MGSIFSTRWVGFVTTGSFVSPLYSMQEDPSSTVSYPQLLKIWGKAAIQER